MPVYLPIAAMTTFTVKVSGTFIYEAASKEEAMEMCLRDIETQDIPSGALVQLKNVRIRN